MPNERQLHLRFPKKEPRKAAKDTAFESVQATRSSPVRCFCIGGIRVCPECRE